MTMGKDKPARGDEWRKKDALRPILDDLERKLNAVLAPHGRRVGHLVVNVTDNDGVGFTDLSGCFCPKCSMNLVDTLQRAVSGAHMRWLQEPKERVH